MHQWTHRTQTHTHTDTCAARDRRGGKRWGLAWRERNYKLRGGERRRGGKRGMGTQKMVRRSNYGMPGLRRQCRGACTHMLQNTLWRPALSKHCLVWRRFRETEREKKGKRGGKHMKEQEFKGHHPTPINIALNQQSGLNISLVLLLVKIRKSTKAHTVVTVNIIHRFFMGDSDINIYFVHRTYHPF